MRSHRDAKHLNKSARSMASFPDDVLTDIFLKFSSRSLVRFRCVCKSWNSLLRSPHFIKAYLERSITSRKFNLLKFNLNSFATVHIDNQPKNEFSDYDISFVKNGINLKLIGSCNGIVCLSTFDSVNPQHTRIFLWNPSTGQNLALSQPNFYVSNLVGFGFNPLSGHPDDFTVVNMNIYIGRYPNYTSQVEVYSFREKGWKQLGNIFPPLLTQHLDNQVIFENFICWCPYFRLNREIITLLVLFDVDQDAFQTIALPDKMPLREKCISLLDGCLSVVVRNSTTECYEVWIMKELGVCKSWTKLYTIEVSTICRPVGFANSEDFFFVRPLDTRFKSSSEIVLYNVRSEMFDTYEVALDCYYATQLVTCIDSPIFLS